jgi:thiol-disulfide isomerase/thioredoxin
LELFTDKELIMDKKMFKIGFLSGILLIIGIGIYGYFNMRITFSDNTKSIELSQLELQNLSSEKISLKKGKPKVLNFWATWCDPCVKEFPEFVKLNTKYGDKVDIIMISDEDVLNIKNFKLKKDYNLNMVRSTKSFNEYGLIGRPATFFYNAKGELVSKWGGSITYDKLEEGVTGIID